MLEMEIIALSVTNDAAAKAIQGAMDEYRKLLNPSIASQKEDEKLVQMRRMVEAEANKVYILGKDDRLSRETLNKALTSENKNLATWAAHEVHKEDMAQRRLQQDLRRKKLRFNPRQGATRPDGSKYRG
jgi:hypothetical protein